MYSILDLKTDVSGILHGTTIDQITNFEGIANRTAKQLILDVDAKETKRIVQMPVIFSQIFDYGLAIIAPDLKGNKIIDVRPQANRLPTDNFMQRYSRDFDLNKQTSLRNMLNVDYNSGVKTLRVDGQFLPVGTVIDYLNTIIGNGTWTAGGNASNLSVNNQDFTVGSGGSLQFDLAAAGSAGYIENSTMSPLDISEMLNQGTFFNWAKLPTASHFTSIELRIGSSAANYYKITVTLNQMAVAFQNNWNLLNFPWLGATVVGSPNPAHITYARITYNYDGTAQTGVHANWLFVEEGRNMELVYYSKYLFRDAITGAWQETVTDDSNLINLDTDSYNLFLNLFCFLLAQQTQGLDALFYDAGFFKNEYQAGLITYKSLYKSEIILPTATYYNMKKSNPQQYWNRGPY